MRWDSKVHCGLLLQASFACHAHSTRQFLSQLLKPCVAALLTDAAAACVCVLLSCALQLALLLEPHKQLELWARLGNVLLVDGLLPASLEGSIQTALALANSTGTLHSSPFFS